MSSEGNPENDQSKFNLKLYQFVIPDDVDAKDVRPPPNWALLDHLIAVIWRLYSPFSLGTPLGIVPLQWALEFLKSIVRKDKTYQNIEAIMKGINELLIKKYASLKPKLEKHEKKSKKKVKAQKKRQPKELSDETVEKMPSQETMQSDDLDKEKSPRKSEGPKKPNIPISLMDIMSRQPPTLVFSLSEVESCSSENVSNGLCYRPCQYSKDYDDCQKKPVNESFEERCKECLKLEKNQVNGKLMKEEILKRLATLKYRKNTNPEEDILTDIIDMIKKLEPEDIVAQNSRK